MAVLLFENGPVGGTGDKDIFSGPDAGRNLGGDFCFCRMEHRCYFRNCQGRQGAVDPSKEINRLIEKITRIANKTACSIEEASSAIHGSRNFPANWKCSGQPTGVITETERKFSRFFPEI